MTNVKKLLEQQPKSLSELLPYATKKYGEEIALVADDNEYSFRLLDNMAAKVANALKFNGVNIGDRVSLLGVNSAEWLACYHGVLRIGAVINPLNSMLTSQEIEYAVNDCEAKVLIATGDKLCVLKEQGMLNSMELMISLDETGPAESISFADLILTQTANFTSVQVDPKSLSTICYTSGTTGQPKGAMQSHESVIFNIIMTAYMHCRNQGDIVVSALPCPHVYGNVVMNSALLNGLKLIMHRRFDEEAILQSIELYGATILEGVPAMYMALLNHSALDYTDLSSLRFCTVGGQTMPITKMESVKRRFKCPLIELWGMTELAGLGTTFFADKAIKLGSIGIPLPTVEIQIIDSEDPSVFLNVGEVGELLVRGPIVMMGYFNNVEATNKAIDADGWLYTGDIAYKDKDDFIFIVDRKKDMILCAGYNIYPAEIERVIAMHPAVAMVAVGSQPDDIKGEVPKAYVIISEGYSSSIDDISTHCRKNLAAYKIPRQIQFVKDFPKTSSGKIMRRKLQTLDKD